MPERLVRSMPQLVVIALGLSVTSTVLWGCESKPEARIAPSNSEAQTHTPANLGHLPRGPGRGVDRVLEPRRFSGAQYGRAQEELSTAARAVVFSEAQKHFDTAFHVLAPTTPHPGREAATGERHDRLMLRTPTVRVDSAGVGVMTFETVRPLIAGSAFYGARLVTDSFATPRHRHHARELRTDESRLVYQLPVDLRRLLRPVYDVIGMGQGRPGEISYRLEIHGEGDTAARVYDGRFGARCDPAPCTERSRFVQVPVITLGPFVDKVESSSATLSFETDAAVLAGIAIAKEGDALRLIRGAGGPQRRHEIRVDELEPDTRYRYICVGAGAEGEAMVYREGTFQTAPKKDSTRPFTFVMLSDSRSGHGSADAHYAGSNREVLQSLLAQSLHHEPEFIVFVGDLVDGYTTSPSAFEFELRAWQHSSEPVGAFVPIYESMGNHEAVVDMWPPRYMASKLSKQSAESIFGQRFVNPENAPIPATPDAPPYAENTYSFDWGSAHVSVINSNYWVIMGGDQPGHPARGQGQREGFVNDASLDWLDKDLQAARDRGMKHLFVATHEPAFPNGGHASDGMYWAGRVPEVVQQRDKLLHLLDKHGVVAMFHGDEHNYSRMRIDDKVLASMKNPVWQIISGGAGAPYYAQEDVPWKNYVDVFDPRQHFVAVTVEGDNVQIRAVSRMGETMDLFDAAR